MSLRKPLTACAAAMAAFAIAGPATTASAAPGSTDRAAAGVTTASLTCPIWYGFPNPANGCQPYWAFVLGLWQSYWP
jgi:hypothetical protein